MATDHYIARFVNPDGFAATADITITVAPLLGLSTAAGTATRQSGAAFPGIRYFRDFGRDGADADSLPELTPHGTGKLADLPDAVAHVSWKDDVEQLTGWLDGLDRRVYLTWWHEPMGDVPPATLRATGTRLTQILAIHPRRSLVLGHGPIVTRYWLDEGRGDPADWAYPGMTHYGIDCYSRDTSAYWTPQRMFAAAFGKVRATCPGVRLWVPEYGLVRTTADTTGAGRAAAIREHVGWLRAQPDVVAAAYWSNWPEYQLAAGSPEAQAWRDLQALNP